MKPKAFIFAQTKNNNYAYTTPGVLEISFTGEPSFDVMGEPVEVQIPKELEKIRFRDRKLIMRFGCSKGIFKYKSWYYVQYGKSYFFPISNDPDDYSRMIRGHWEKLNSLPGFRILDISK